jgi:hypothetical protein
MGARRGALSPGLAKFCFDTDFQTVFIHKEIAYDEIAVSGYIKLIAS